jgi:arginyl-tRNA synthetase
MVLEQELKPATETTIRRILTEGDRYGRTQDEAARRVLVEFVSANPNGPITVAHGRGGAIGDTLASLFEWTGNTVSREFYVNDAVGSKQMQVFAQSLLARYRQLLGRDAEIPEDGYNGEYVTEIARQIVDTDGDRYLALTPEEAIPVFQPLALSGMHDQQAATLQAFGIRYDTWFSEQTLHASGAVESVLKSLKERGFAFDEKGALWLRSTRFGDENDRVLVRAEGTATYLAGDLAYHADKLARGFDLLVDVWGEDHHGYIARTKAGLAALGYTPDQLQIALYQPVRLIRNGVEEKTGRRAGNILTLRELTDEVGKDAARFFFLLQRADAPQDFDLDLAHKQTRENPFYDVQYAYARCGSAITKAAQAGITLPGSDSADLDLTSLTGAEEAALVQKLADFPDEILQARDTLAPYRIARYARDLALLLHTWQDRDSDSLDSRAQLALVTGVRITLANALTILGISAHEHATA